MTVTINYNCQIYLRQNKNRGMKPDTIYEKIHNDLTQMTTSHENKYQVSRLE